jgi:hypothetical protein
MAQTVLAHIPRWGCDVKGFTNAAERMDARERPVLGELERDLKIYTKKIYTTPHPVIAKRAAPRHSPYPWHHEVDRARTPTEIFTAAKGAASQCHRLMC